MLLIVSEVLVIFVENIIFFVFGGVGLKILVCSFEGMLV